MQKTFAPVRKNVPTTKQTTSGRTQKPQRSGKTKGNYSVDFSSKLMETTPANEDATSEALNQKGGKHDDSFTLVGQKETLDDQVKDKSSDTDFKTKDASDTMPKVEHSKISKDIDEDENRGRTTTLDVDETSEKKLDEEIKGGELVKD